MAEMCGVRSQPAPRKTRSNKRQDSPGHAMPLQRWDPGESGDDGLPPRYDETLGRNSVQQTWQDFKLFKALVRGFFGRGSEGADGCKTGYVDLTIARLEALRSLNTGATQCKYAEDGMSRDRIKRVLSEGVCDCKCKRPPKVPQQLCNCFWGLPKAAQDGVLWSLQAEGHQKRKQWCLQGLVRFWFCSSHGVFRTRSAERPGCGFLESGSSAWPGAKVFSWPGWPFAHMSRRMLV